MLGSVMPPAFGVSKSIRFRLTSKQHYLSGVLDFQSICQTASNGEFHYFEQVGGRQEVGDRKHKSCYRHWSLYSGSIGLTAYEGCERV